MHWGEKHRPCQEFLRRLLEYTFQVYKITSCKRHWNVEHRYTCNSSGLLVKDRRQEISKSCCCLKHHRKNEVKLNELVNTVLESDRKIDADVYEEWYYEHDRYFCEPFRHCINPNVIHSTVTLSHINWLFPLEYDNSW